MSVLDVRACLPQAPPFLFVDRVVSVDAQVIVCEKLVSHNEPYLAGHFPGNPIVPGVLLVEMCAQACLLLAGERARLAAEADGAAPSKTSGGARIGYVAKLDGFVFQRPARPGDVLRITVTHQGAVGAYEQVRATVTLGDTKTRICRGELTVSVPPEEGAGRGA